MIILNILVFSSYIYINFIFNHILLGISMKTELLKLIDLQDASYYVWKNKTKKKLIWFFLKYFSESDLKEYNEKNQIIKLDFLYSSSVIGCYTFCEYFEELIDNEQHLETFVKYLISYKKEHDLDFLGGQIPVEIDFDYEEIIKLKNMFVLGVRQYQVDSNFHNEFSYLHHFICQCSISDFLFIHHNILNNFKLMIDILDKNVSFNVSEDILSFGNKRNSVIKDLLYKFLIKFYIRLYNLDENNFKFKSNEMKFKKIKSFCDKKFKSDRMIDILDITRNEEIIKEYKKRKSME